MRSTSILLLSITLLALACSNNNTTESGGSEHDQLVQKEKVLKREFEETQHRLEDLQEDNDVLNDILSNKEAPDSASVATIESFRNILLTHYGTLRKHEQIFKTHKDYIRKHEKTALSPGEIQAQHARMKTDHEKTERELRTISSDLSRIGKAMKEMKEQLK